MPGNASPRNPPPTSPNAEENPSNLGGGTSGQPHTCTQPRDAAQMMPPANEDNLDSQELDPKSPQPEIKIENPQENPSNTRIAQKIPQNTPMKTKPPETQQTPKRKRSSESPPSHQAHKTPRLKLIRPKIHQPPRPKSPIKSNLTR